MTFQRESVTSLGKADYVAGRRAYEVAMVPRSQASLIARVTIAVDAETGLPLRVAEYVRGQGSPIVDDRYQSVSYAVPAASNFAFHAPPNARWLQAPTLGAALEPPRHFRRHRQAAPAEPDERPARSFGGPTSIRIVGTGWDEVVVATGVPDFGLRDLFGQSTAVSGSFGRGLLARTSALTVLFLDDGRLAAGVVTPQRLEAALSQGGSTP